MSEKTVVTASGSDGCSETKKKMITTPCLVPEDTTTLLNAWIEAEQKSMSDLPTSIEQLANIKNHLHEKQNEQLQTVVTQIEDSVELYHGQRRNALTNDEDIKQFNDETLNGNSDDAFVGCDDHTLHITESIQRANTLTNNDDVHIKTDMKNDMKNDIKPFNNLFKNENSEEGYTDTILAPYNNIEPKVVDLKVYRRQDRVETIHDTVDIPPSVDRMVDKIVTTRNMKFLLESDDLPSPNDPWYEPIIHDVEEGNRLIISTVKYPDLQDLYNQHTAQFWTPSEIIYERDLVDWNTKLLDHERSFFKNILAFFAPADMIVNENLLHNFLKVVKYQEARLFYTFQAAMENIHSIVYSTLITVLIPDEMEQDVLFNAFKTHPGIACKVNWAQRWTEGAKDYVETLIAFVAVEGILFTGSFAAIFWLKERGIMPGLTFSNELISRDERLHCQFACNIYRNHIKHKLTVERVYEIVQGAVDAETQFFKHSFGGMSIGIMNESTMLQYVQYCADMIFDELGVPRLYRSTNPFPFTNLVSIDGRTNFFERRVGEYRLSRIPTTNATCDNHIPYGPITFNPDF